MTVRNGQEECDGCGEVLTPISYDYCRLCLNDYCETCMRDRECTGTFDLNGQHESAAELTK